jgi:hypothetical protein
MSLIPYSRRPSVIIRQRAIWRGVLGPSMFWKVIAVFFFGRRAGKRIFGRRSDDLGIWKIGVGSVISIAVFKPLTRRERKRRGITLSSLRADAAADLEATSRAS